MTRPLSKLLAEEDPAIVASARRSANTHLLNLNLAEIRHRALERNRITAETIDSDLKDWDEIDNDSEEITVRELKHYIEAMGGQMRIVVDFQDGWHYGFKC